MTSLADRLMEVSNELDGLCSEYVHNTLEEAAASLREAGRGGINVDWLANVIRILLIKAKEGLEPAIDFLAGQGFPEELVLLSLPGLRSTKIYMKKRRMS